MSTRHTLTWALLLAAPLWGLEPEVQLEIVSFPPAAKAYLETSTGPVYLGACEGPLRLAPPALHDRLGQVTQYTAGTLTLRLPNHQDLKVTVTPDQWSGGRLPKEGALTLPPLGLATTAQDALSAHPWLWGLLAAVPVALALGLRSRRPARARLSGDPLLGRHLGEYLVVSRLGQGGMGTVYKVTDPNGGAYAAKVLYLAGDSETQEARFRREVRLISQLKHPSLVRCLDYNELDGLIYYVMDLVDGFTFEKEIHEGGRPWPEVWSLLEPVFSGLEYAHSQGVVHRDLKPSNLMVVAATRNVKILDFGLAREKSRTAVTKTGNAMGTPHYIAPEQISASGKDVDPRTDQYSLGVILFELLTGRPPFDSEKPEELLAMHLTQPAPRLRQVRPDLPPLLERIVAKMLEKDPKLRYPELGEVRTLLATVSAGGRPGGGPGAPVGRQNDATVDLRVPKAPGVEEAPGLSGIIEDAGR